MLTSQLWHLISLVSSLAASASICSLGVMLVIYDFRRRKRDALEALRLGLRNTSNTSDSFTNTFADLERSGDYLGGRLTINMLSVIVAVLSLYLLVDKIAEPSLPVFKLTDVHVLERYSDNVYRLDVYDPVNKVRNQFTATFCAGSDLSPEIRPGATLTLLQYWEDRHEHCYDVSGRNHTGYTLLRDSRGEAIYDNGHDD